MIYHVRVMLLLVFSALCALSGDIFQIIESQNLQALSTVTNDMRQINSVNHFGDTPLMVAARRGYVEQATMLIAAGADVNARNRGFTVKDQLENYLRRTGEHGKRIEGFLRRFKLGSEMVLSFHRESESLGGTAERIAAWRTILEFVRERRSTASSLGSFPDEMKNMETGWQGQTSNGKLTMNELHDVFASMEATTNELHLVLREGNSRFAAVFDNRESRNIFGSESVIVHAGGTFKLIGKDTLLTLNGLANRRDDASALWRFDVGFRSLDPMTGRIKMRHGVLSAKKRTGKGIVIEVDVGRD